MSFADDPTAVLDFPKTDYRTEPGVPTSQKIPASHWNRLCQAVTDIRDGLLAGTVGGGSAGVVVIHTSNGSDGTEFAAVAIGATMADTTYSVFWACAGGTSGDGRQISNVPELDIPDADRTTTTFRFTTGAQMANGDRIKFLVVGDTA